MNEIVLVRKIHLDYAGADGFPKPMTMAITSETGQTSDHYVERARQLFLEQFPEWELRSCVVADRDVEIEKTKLRAVPGIPGVWGLG